MREQVEDMEKSFKNYILKSLRCYVNETGTGCYHQRILRLRLSSCKFKIAEITHLIGGLEDKIENCCRLLLQQSAPDRMA